MLYLIYCKNVTRQLSSAAQIMQGHQHFKIASLINPKGAEISWTRTRAGHRIYFSVFLLFHFCTKKIEYRKLYSEEIFQLFVFHQSRKGWIFCCVLSCGSPPSLCYLAQRSFSTTLLCYAAAFQNLAMFRKMLENSKRKNEKRENCQAVDAIDFVTFGEKAWKPRKNAFKT